MSKTQPEPARIYATIAISFGWLLFLALWLFFYATSFSIIQNIGIFLASLAILGIVVVVLWVPWGLKHSD